MHFTGIYLPPPVSRLPSEDQRQTGYLRFHSERGTRTVVDAGDLKVELRVFGLGHARFDITVIRRFRGCGGSLVILGGGARVHEAGSIAVLLDPTPGLVRSTLITVYTLQ